MVAQGLKSHRPGLRRLALCAALCLLAAGIGLTRAFAAAPARRPHAANPHWKANACGSCHTIENGKKLPITPEKADDICLKCHDGAQAAYEFHPVDRVLDPDKFNRPKDWPLVDNRLVCLTCHDMKSGCTEKPEQYPTNRMFLRNFQSGRAKSQPFCRNCHQEGAYKKLNPHQMLMGEQNEIVEEKCLFCHTKPLDRKARERTGESSLKADQVALCKDCHPQHKDPMQQGHVGLKISDEMLARIYAREQLGLSSQLGPQVLAQIKAAGSRPTKMVPGKDGTIVCSTCHNPHQYGVFPSDSVLSYRAMRFLKDGRAVSPVRNQAWCRHCHEF